MTAGKRADRIIIDDPQAPVDLGYGVDSRGRPLVPQGTVGESTHHDFHAGGLVTTYGNDWGDSVPAILSPCTHAFVMTRDTDLDALKESIGRVAPGNEVVVFVGGDPIDVASFKMTNNAPSVLPRLPDIAHGVFEVKGEMTAYFENGPLLRRWFNRSDRQYLAMIRPFMTRRAFRRERGRVRAMRRAR